MIGLVGRSGSLAALAALIYTGDR